MPTRPPPLAPGSRARVAVATGEVVALGTWAHAAAEGALPGPVLFLALSVVAGGVCLALRRRLLSLPVAVGLAVGGQLALHVVLAYAAGHGGHAVHPPHGAHAAVSALDTEMLTTHAVAAVVTALALRWQERLAEVLVRALRVPWSRPPLGGGRPLPPAGARRRPRTSCAVLAVAPRRGPPVPA